MALRGKIAAIVDDSSVVINLGSTQGVKPGMRFQAVFETDAITDPDNPKQVLGRLSFIINTLEAKNVMEKMSYCEVNRPVLAFGTFFDSVKYGPTKIDENAERLLGTEGLRLKVGTVVIEQPAEPRETTAPKSGADPGT
jgi:hypothetical protein